MPLSQLCAKLMQGKEIMTVPAAGAQSGTHCQTCGQPILQGSDHGVPVGTQPASIHSNSPILGVVARIVGVAARATLIFCAIVYPFVLGTGLAAVAAGGSWSTMLGSVKVTAEVIGKLVAVVTAITALFELARL